MLKSSELMCIEDELSRAKMFQAFSSFCLVSFFIIIIILFFCDQDQR